MTDEGIDTQGVLRIAGPWSLRVLSSLSPRAEPIGIKCTAPAAITISDLLLVQGCLLFFFSRAIMTEN